MKLRLTLLLLAVMTGGCEQAVESEWQQKYQDCKVLAGLVQKQQSQFIKVPDCEQIPKLCSKDPNNSACAAELKKYYRE